MICLTFIKGGMGKDNPLENMVKLLMHELHNNKKKREIVEKKKKKNTIMAIFSI